MATTISKRQSTDESDGDTSALKALKDFDDIESESKLSLDKLSISSYRRKSIENRVTIVKEQAAIDYQKLVLKSLSNENHTTERINYSTYSDVSTPSIDSKSSLTSRNGRKVSKVNTSDETGLSYSSDFTDDTDQTNDEMSPWEKWFVLKQKQIRRRADVEKKKKLLEEQKLNEERKKKAEENEKKQKMWFERKKIEEKARREKEEELKKNNGERATNNEYRFEKWYLKKLEEKKSQRQYSQELIKYEELQKEIRRKKNEKAQMEWMNKAKQRPMTPRVTYGYVGDSVIGFYDSTSHPPPTYINPIPWQP